MENSLWILIIFGLLSLFGFATWGLTCLKLVSPKSEKPTGSFENANPPPLKAPERQQSPTRAEGHVVSLAGGATDQPVMFNWNGHLWEAHEVLGVKVGSSLEDIDRAFLTESEAVDPHSRAFLKMALRSLHERKSAQPAPTRRNK